MQRTPVIGIVGSEGAFGRWLRQFFEQRMGLRVIGRDDPGRAEAISEAELVEGSDVLIFSVPIRVTTEVIAHYVDLAQGREAGKLWLDLTSIKAAPVAAMLASGAEVVGLHPMTAPPKAPTLKGRTLVVCEARLDAWRGWLQQLLAALQAECVQTDAEHHDKVMALVQGMVHASHLAQAGVLQDYGDALGGLESLLPYRTASFEMDAAVTARILALNPAIYEDIQFCNPYVREMLDRLSDRLTRMRAMVGQGDAARPAFRQQFLTGPRDALGDEAVADGNYRYERLAYLLGDLTETLALSVYLPEDRAGSLRVLLNVFEQYGINLASIHSSRTPAGELHFRIGFDPDSDAERIRQAATEIDASGIGRVLAGV